MSSPIRSVAGPRTGSLAVTSGSPTVAEASPRKSSPLDSLLLVSPDVVMPHELAVEAHVKELVSEILADGYVRHPIVSAAAGTQYLLLDGTHRLAALNAIGVRRVPLQVFAHGDIRFDSWAKIVVHRRGCAPVLETPLVWQRGDNAGAAVRVFASNGESWHSRTATTLEMRHEALTRVLLAIGDAEEVRASVPSMAKPDGAGSFALTFGSWNLAEVIESAQQGRRLPSGLTRVIASGRILNLRVPLEMLQAPQLDAAAWAGFIAAAKRHARVYDEPTVLID